MIQTVRFILVLLSAISLVSFRNASAETHNKITIGVSTALTGNAATLGSDIRRSLLFARDDLAPDKYEFLFEDDACSGKGAATVARKLIDVNKVRYVLGFACSSTVLGSASIYEQAKVVAISPSASAATISQAGEYIYRTWASDERAAAVLTQHISKRHKVLGVISELTDFSQQLFDGVKSAARESSLKIVAADYSSDAPDYRSLLLRLRAAKIDALFINSQTEVTFLAVLKQAKDLNMSMPIYGAYWPGSDAFIKSAGALSEGIVFVDAPASEDVLTTEGREKLARFKSIYGRLDYGDMLFVTTYEAFRALHQAITSGDDVRHYLNTTTFHGILGDWSFDSHGDMQGMDYIIKIVRNGKVERFLR
jgi:branched-chain amino acid transport system substrate-binding protein